MLKTFLPTSGSNPMNGYRLSVVVPVVRDDAKHDQVPGHPLLPISTLLLIQQPCLILTFRAGLLLYIKV